MTANDVGALNIGATVRDGLQLKTVEVVALLHNACQQLDAGAGATLQPSIDNLWVTAEGRVVLPETGTAAPIRMTVASLLEDLLPQPEDGSDVPAALRTLPSRLRAAGSVHQPADLSDLLTALRWHLPADSQEVLRDLVARVGLSGAALDAPGIESFLDEDPAPLPAPAASLQAGRRRSTLAAAALVVVAIGATGYAAYRLTANRIQSGSPPMAALSGVDEPAPLPAPRGRIVVADADPERVAAPRPAAATEAHALDLPVPGGVFSPSFASGGTTLLFHAGHNTSGRLFQASLDERGRASAIKPLFEDRGRTYHPRLAPDGSLVAFDSDRDGERGVYVAARNGANIERVSGAGFAAVPSWSPDMKWLAFVRGEPSRPKVWNLWLREVATGALARHSAFRSGQVWSASWFPDARSFCYSHDDRLVIAQVDSATVRTFESPVTGRLIRTPAVSPDGTRIVFQVHRDGIWLMDARTGVMRRILADPTAEEFAWDSDGTRIAYHSRRDGQWRIWLLTA